MTEDDRDGVGASREERGEVDGEFLAVFVLHFSEEGWDRVDPLLLLPPVRYSSVPPGIVDAPIEFLNPSVPRITHPFPRHPEILLRLGVVEDLGG